MNHLIYILYNLTIAVVFAFITIRFFFIKTTIGILKEIITEKILAEQISRFIQYILYTTFIISSISIRHLVNFVERRTPIKRSQVILDSIDNLVQGLRAISITLVLFVICVIIAYSILQVAISKKGSKSQKN